VSAGEILVREESEDPSCIRHFLVYLEKRDVKS
jgi:hypothetical protein